MFIARFVLGGVWRTLLALYANKYGHGDASPSCRYTPMQTVHRELDWLNGPVGLMGLISGPRLPLMMGLLWPRLLLWIRSGLRKLDMHMSTTPTFTRIASDAFWEEARSFLG